jgi:hypothetical protein
MALSSSFANLAVSPALNQQSLGVAYSIRT